MLKSDRFFSCFSAAIAALFFVFLPAGVSAAEAISVSPLRVDELVSPGEVLERVISVTNNASSTKKLYAYLRDFKAEGEEGVPRLIEPGAETGSFMSSWIDITDEGFDFAAGDTKEFKFTITVPAEAGPGGYYGAIIFGTQAPDVRNAAIAEGAAIGISQQAGALILLQIPGEAAEEAAIRDFTTDKRVYPTPFEVKFASRVENRGNVHIKPHGVIEITNMLGKPMATLRVNDRGANVLPASTRRFDNVWSGDFAFGRYKALLALSFGTTAEAGGGGRQTLSYARYFWIIPWKLSAYAGLGMIFLIAMVFLFLKLMKDRAITRAMAEMGIGKEQYVKRYQGPSPTLHLGLIILVMLAIVFLLAAATYFLFI